MRAALVATAGKNSAPSIRAAAAEPFRTISHLRGCSFTRLPPILVVLASTAGAISNAEMNQPIAEYLHTAGKFPTASVKQLAVAGHTGAAPGLCGRASRVLSIM
ncbi:MAG: hypothetical protein R2749_22950 [Acidimicrobiales bacterium]